jgi:hypothetical protein
MIAIVGIVGGVYDKGPRNEGHECGKQEHPLRERSLRVEANRGPVEDVGGNLPECRVVLHKVDQSVERLIEALFEYLEVLVVFSGKCRTELLAVMTSL